MVPIHLRGTCCYGFWSKLKTKPRSKNQIADLNLMRMQSKFLPFTNPRGYNFRSLLYRSVGEPVVEKGWMIKKKKFGLYMLHLPEPPPGCIFITKNPKGISPNPHLADASPEDFKLAENYLSNLSSYFSLQNINDKKLENDYCELNEFTDLKPSILTNDIPLGQNNFFLFSKIKGDHTEKDHDESEIQKEIVSFEKRLGAHTFPAGTQAGNFLS